MPVELTSETSHEDIQVAVNEAIEKVEEDRVGEETTDAAKIASDTDEPTGDETAESQESGSGDKEDTASEGDDSPQGNSHDGKTGVESKSYDEWFDDSLKAEAAAYGISEDELADFTSREEAERALRLFGRSTLEAGRKEVADKHSDEGDEPKAKDEEADGQLADGQLADGQLADGRYEIALDKEVYEEDIVDEFTRMRDHYESRVSALETRFSEVDARAEEQTFDNLVDSLGHADLFGKSGKESDKELQRRQDLFVAAKAQRIGLQQLGRDVELNESLVGRVARMVFADEIGKKELKARTRKVSRQSNGRMGGGVTRPGDPTETLRDEARRLYKELESA